MVKYIELTNSDEYTLVDQEDYDYLIQWNWQLDISPTSKSIRRTITFNYKTIRISLAREIAERMNLDLTNDIDHIDRNPLNNQRSNLRSATRSQNCINRIIQKNNTTGYKGVSFHNASQKYSARITINGQRINLGVFEDLEDAARAYDKVAKQYLKEFAILNFPD